MDNKLKTVDAETLLSTPMSKTMFIVDGLISQGVNVISGASKIGKSWLMLWLGLQVAQGNSIWGLPTLQCDVLYLSLEDTQRRIKDRLYNLTDSAPDNLYFAVTSGLIGGGLEEQITDFLTEHPATKLVIIDTLQKVRDSKGSAGKAGMYGNDYDDISSIKRIADGFNIAILLVHHLRKLQDSDDPFNDVSGSTGIIGAADTNFILRRKRSGNAATLLVSGRDVEYQELTLQFNDLVWELVERKNSEDIHINTVPYKGGHFAAFPPKLAETCILAGCPKGGVVLDPFFGSGTTGLAAKSLDRHYIGIELNYDYCTLARARIGGETN